MKITHTGRRSLGAAALFGLAVFGAAAHPAAAAPAGADAILTQRMADPRPTGWSAVIVKLDGGLTAERQARLSALGADITRRLSIIQSVVVRVPTRNLKALASLPFVTHLSYDGGVAKCDEFTVGSSEASTAWQAPYSVGGQGVTVAIVDSGIHSQHADLGQAAGAVGNLLGTTLKGNRVIDSVSFVTDAKGKTLSPDDSAATARTSRESSPAAARTPTGRFSLTRSLGSPRRRIW
jgi:subtilisin family serine protease